MEGVRDWKNYGKIKFQENPGFNRTVPGILHGAGLLILRSIVLQYTLYSRYYRYWMTKEIGGGGGDTMRMEKQQWVSFLRIFCKSSLFSFRLLPFLHWVWFGVENYVSSLLFSLLLKNFLFRIKLLYSSVL